MKYLTALAFAVVVTATACGEGEDGGGGSGGEDDGQVCAAREQLSNIERRPKCTVEQLTRGEWVNTTWVLADDCDYHWFTSAEANQCLANQSVLFTGNSVTRQLMFHLRALLLNTDNILDRVWEQMVCPKPEIDKSLWAAPESQESFPANGLCYGYCTCGTEVNSTKLNFIWHVNWWNDEIRDHLVAELQTNPNPPSLFTFSAGLNLSWKLGPNALDTVKEQLVQMAIHLPPLLQRVQTPIFRTTTSSCEERIQTVVNDVDKVAVERLRQMSEKIVLLDVAQTTTPLHSWQEPDTVFGL